MTGVKGLLLIFAAVAAASAAGITIHRSFRGGYPADISEARQSAAENGASEIPSVESHHADSVV